MSMCVSQSGIEPPDFVRFEKQENRKRVKNSPIASKEKIKRIILLLQCRQAVYKCRNGSKDPMACMGLAKRCAGDCCALKVSCYLIT